MDIALCRPSGQGTRPQMEFPSTLYQYMGPSVVIPRPMIQRYGTPMYMVSLHRSRHALFLNVPPQPCQDLWVKRAEGKPWTKGKVLALRGVHCPKASNATTHITFADDITTK
jgi:hypothetical protein